MVGGMLEHEAITGSIIIRPNVVSSRSPVDETMIWRPAHSAASSSKRA